VHLAAADGYWRADRLDLAHAAMGKALRVGVPAGNWYNLQRVIEAELAARETGEVLRLDETLLIESSPAAWATDWPKLVELARESLRHVTAALDVRWGRPVLLTLFTERDWLVFMRARYGYYATRAPWHKVCLPAYPPLRRNDLRRALVHEFAHAAAHELAGNALPLWLDEGVAMRLEEAGSAPKRMPMREAEATLHDWNTALGSAASWEAYAAAGDFVGQLVETVGFGALADWLRRIGAGVDAEKAFRQVYGRTFRDVERAWLDDVRR
jgi:hypothetical protein